MKKILLNSAVLLLTGALSLTPITAKTRANDIGPKVSTSTPAPSAEISTAIPKTETPSKPKAFTAKIGGRFLLEGLAHMGHYPSSLNHSVGITDLRLTGQLSYEDWYLRIDVGFDGNKVGIKDSFLQWSRKGNIVRVGHTLGSFGIDPAVATYDYLFNSPANIHNLVFFGRHIGLIYNRVQPHYHISFGTFMGDNLNMGPDIEMGFNTALRAVYRPILEEDQVLQVGASGIFRLPNRSKSTGLRAVNLGCTGVTFLQSPMYQQLSITDARNESAAGIEFYYAYKKWLVQAEYMGLFVNRNAAQTFVGHGGYIQAGYLITGSHFGYDAGEGLPTAPADPKSLQLVFRYNFSTLGHNHWRFQGKVYIPNRMCHLPVLLCY